MKNNVKRTVFTLLAIVSAAAASTLALWRQLLPWLLIKLYDMQVNVSQTGAASVGIIGGADGPTAIFVTSKSPVLPYVPYIAAGVFAVLTAVFLLLAKKAGEK